jgi:hypothetical protein
MDKHPMMCSKYYDDPIITSQGTIILEENVDTLGVLRRSDNDLAGNNHSTREC